MATQFSVIRAPTVAILLFHLTSSHHFSGRRLWRLSFLYCQITFIKFGRRQWRPFCVHTHIPFDFIASFLWAPPVHSDSVFCCSGTASGDPQGVVTIESLKYHQSSPYIWGGAEHTRVHTYIHRKITNKNTKQKQNKPFYADL